MKARDPFSMPSVTFPREPGSVPRFAVALHGKRIAGAYITRVATGWRVRCAGYFGDVASLDEARDLFKAAADQLQTEE
jgi:hypothetical protein